MSVPSKAGAWVPTPVGRPDRRDAARAGPRSVERDRDAAGLVERRLGERHDLLGRRVAVAAGSSSSLQPAPVRASRRDGERARQRRRGGMRVSLAHRRSPPRRTADGPGAGGDRLAPGRPGAVAPAGRPRAGRPGRRCAAAARAGRGAGPGEDQGVLALEEAVAAHAAGGAALGGVLAERRHLDRARLGAGQRGRRSRTTVTTTASAGSTRAEPGDPLARRRAGRRPCRRRSGPAAGPPSAPKCSSCASVVTKQSVSSPVVSSHGADDLVAVLEPDHLPLVAGRAPRG